MNRTFSCYSIDGNTIINVFHMVIDIFMETVTKNPIVSILIDINFCSILKQSILLCVIKVSHRI